MHLESAARRLIAFRRRPTSGGVTKVRRYLPSVETVESRCLLTGPGGLPTSVIPVHRQDTYGLQRESAIVAQIQKGDSSVEFFGDSNIDFWSTTGADAWARKITPDYNASNFGIGGEKTQTLLWRLQNGELADHPSVVVLQIGMNNVLFGDYGETRPDVYSASVVSDTVAGIAADLAAIREYSPQSKVLLMGVLPIGATANDPQRLEVRDINTRLAAMADGVQVRYLDIGPDVLNSDGGRPDTSYGIHLSPTQYGVWADALYAPLHQMLAPDQTRANALIAMDNHGMWWATDSTSGTSHIIADWSFSTGWRNVMTGDFNGDGLTDVTAMNAYGQWFVGLGSATGYTTSVFATWNPSAPWAYFHVADFNGDGKDDIIGMTSYGDWWTGLSDDKSFNTSLAARWNPAGHWSNPQVGDFNGDGRPDIMGRTSWGDFWVGVNTGSGYSAALWASWNPAAPWTDFEVGDFNGDGRTDLAGFTAYGQWWAGVSNGSAFNTRLWTTWATQAAWTNFVVGDFSGDGKTDIAASTVSGDWWVGLSDGVSSFSSNYSPSFEFSPGWNHVIALRPGVASAASIAARRFDGTWALITPSPGGYLSRPLSFWSPLLNWSTVSVGKVPSSLID